MKWISTTLGPVFALNFALNFLLGGCIPANNIPEGDTTPPRVVQVQPASRIVATNEDLHIVFSEPLRKDTINADYFAVAETADVSDSFISDINNPPLSRSHLDIEVEGNSDGSQINIHPLQPWPANSELSLVISKSVADLGNNPLVGFDGLAGAFVFAFVTDDGAPQIIDSSLPPGDPAEISPNLRSIDVEFNQAVYGLNRDNLHLVATDDGLADPQLISVELSEDRHIATLRLADSDEAGCYTLCPTSHYKLQLEDSVSNASGVMAQGFSQNIITLPQPDLQSPLLRGVPVAIASEDSADIRWETDEASSSVLRFGDSADNLDRRIIGEPGLRCEGLGQARHCAHRVVVDGLDLGEGSGRTYYFVIESMDVFNNPPLLVGPDTVMTRRLPKLSINEVYPNPPEGPNGESEKYYEFIEIFNFSDSESYDLGGMSLRKLDGSSSATLGPAIADAATLLAPGQYAVVAARDVFDPAAQGVPSATLLLTDANSARSTLLSGLDNSSAARKAIGLFQGAADDDTAPMISSYGAPEALYDFTEGLSAERLAPELPDLDENWCLSQGAPTPGRPNSVFGMSSCPSQ